MLEGFIKIGELQTIETNDICSIDSIFSDPIMEERFRKFAASLKRIAPRADEFLYFSAIMMHAAEAALVNADGSPKLTSKGEIATARWESNGESIKWICNDSNIKPYKNSNGDIFPEAELLKAYALWKEKPLCIDHRSNSVDAIRGIILDTHYDRKFKRVIALCALDKMTYPDLAKKVQLGYSANVSMGTAVGRAQCYDCGRVARTEQDFCNHMKTKSCYGEVNLDLQPIELSIVVNGADPRAKIRTIIAAANTINNNLAIKEQELLKNSTNFEADKLKQLEDDLKSANEKLAELKEAIEISSNKQEAEPPYGQSSGRYNDTTDAVEQNSVGLNFPERFAHNDALISELKSLRASLEQRLFNMEKGLDNLYKHKEEIMSKDAMNKEAYFQGGGGVNEPTPGQKKYPVDPKNEEMRMKDKQMVGEGPFPNVGNVDGMHPSPSSVDQKDELERKKMLARAEQEERSLRRQAALEKAKKAYFQGGGGVNEPTPHKVKYPIEKLNEELRDNEDKQMVGQKPFPDVGNVEGLHPSPLSAEQKDELARKKMLQRASLKAKFVRVANTDGTDNLGESAWQIYTKDDNGEKLVFTASVDEISGGRSDALFDVIATKDFGKTMLEKIRTVGINKANTVYKKGQAVAEPGASPSGTPEMGGAGVVPAMPDMGAPATPVNDTAAPADEGGKGDPKETALKLAEKVRDMSSDLLEAVRTLTGEQSQMGDMEEGLTEMPKAAASALEPLYAMRKDLNKALLSGMKKALAELREHSEELELIASTVDTKTSMNNEYINSIVEEAFEDTKKAIADSYGLMKAFSKYARGTDGLIKRAKEAEQSMLSLAEDDVNDARKKHKSTDEDDERSTDKSSDENDMSYADDEMHEEHYANDENLHDLSRPLHDHEDHMMEDENMHHDDMDDLGDLDLDSLSDELPEEHEHMTDDMNDTMVELPAGAPVPSGAKAVSEKKAEFDLTTKEGRSAYRAKLAADATGKEDNVEPQDASKIQYSDMLDHSDKLADGQTHLDTKPSDALGLVETPEEQHKKDLEVAKAEPKLREAAERLNQLVVSGKVKENEFDGLISQGLDPDVVKYWKQYYGQAGKEGSEFGKLLTTETFKAKAAEEINTYKIKIARAYELANDMVRRGIISDDRVSINAQVEEVMKWNDDAFESMKRVIAKQKPLAFKKEASLPQVGLIGSGDVYTKNTELDLQSELDKAFSGRKY